MATGMNCSRELSAERLWAMELLDREVCAAWRASEIGFHLGTGLARRSLGTLAEQMERWKTGVAHANPNAPYRLRNTRTGQLVFLRGVVV